VLNTTLSLDEAKQITGGLIDSSKMPSFGYGSSAYDCKRGSKLSKIKGSVCSICYGKKYRFRFPNVKKSLKLKGKAVKHPLWVKAMVVMINAYEQSGYFRFAVTGDIQSLGELLKICAVCRLTPHIKHWLPTHEVGIIGAFKRAGFEFPENLTVRLSADMLEDVPSEALMTSLGVLGGGVSKTNYNCPSSKQDNMCQKCRLCWNKDVKVVVYKQH
jgi:hypothetical protein